MVDAIDHYAREVARVTGDQPSAPCFDRKVVDAIDHLSVGAIRQRATRPSGPCFDRKVVDAIEHVTGFGGGTQPPGGGQPSPQQASHAGSTA